MKARRKGTNDVWQEVQSVALADNEWNLIKAEAIEFQPDTISTELETYNQLDEEKHWQDVRERAAIAVMQAIISNSSCEIHSDSMVIIPKNAVVFADALVKQLKGE